MGTILKNIEVIHGDSEISDIIGGAQTCVMSGTGKILRNVFSLSGRFSCKLELLLLLLGYHSVIWV